MQAHAPLSGTVVVELGTSVAAPIGTLIFAELGAEVIKIENPKGGDDARLWGPPFVDGNSPTFHAINRNKMSAAIDLKDAAQCAALRSFIIDRADVVLQNLRPGLVESYGLDAKSLRAEKPSLIYCNLAAYGSAGPLAKKPGYDPLMQAFGGIMSITGLPDAEPVRVAPAIVDQGAAMWAAIGILAALLRRKETGEGCEVNTSLYETALNWVTPQLATYFGSGRLPKKAGTENFGIAPYKAYQASDGVWLVIAAGNDNLFRRLAVAFGHPEWPDDPQMRTNPDRVANRDKVNALVTDIVASGPSADWLAKLDAAGVPCAPLLSFDQIAEHPQYKAVGMQQEHPGSSIPLLGLPLQFDGTRPPLRHPAPKLGEHTHEVLGAPKKAAE
jgi:crotonobetainyl-CoA:carnitine CoA-transferase CaiB-like acyl-CoA transferase